MLRIKRTIAYSHPCKGTYAFPFAKKKLLEKNKAISNEIPLLYKKKSNK
jgi:hypothetical protein